MSAGAGWGQRGTDWGERSRVWAKSAGVNAYDQYLLLKEDTRVLGKRGQQRGALGLLEALEGVGGKGCKRVLGWLPITNL